MSRRRRRRRAAKHDRPPAWKDGPELLADWGRREPLERGDVALLRQAVREGWSPGPEKAREIIDRVVSAAMSNDARMLVRVAGVLIEIDRRRLVLLEKLTRTGVVRNNGRGGAA